MRRICATEGSVWLQIVGAYAAECSLDMSSRTRASIVSTTKYVGVEKVDR